MDVSHIIFIVVMLQLLCYLPRICDAQTVSSANETSWVVFVKLPSENDNDLHWKDTEVIGIQINCAELSNNKNQYHKEMYVSVISNDENIVSITENAFFKTGCTENNATFSEVHNFTIEGVFLGKTKLEFFCVNQLETVDFEVTDHKRSPTGTISCPIVEYPVTVINEETWLYNTFIIVVAVLMVLLNFGFGCRMKVEVLKAIFKKPLAPLLGLVCQFVVMPLLGLGISKVVPLEPTLGFGLFVVACSPGGGGSNVWTVMLDGDLDLSMTMTFLSKTLALGTMPAWLFGLSRLYLSDTSVAIPYRNLIIGLASLAIPCIFGLLLKRYKPKAAKYVSKAVKPFAVIFLLWVIIVGSVTNLYVYKVMVATWYIIPACCLLPYLGMLLGGILAKLFRQEYPRIVAISVETGLQDSGIAILLLLSSFEKPLGSIAATMPIGIAIFTPVPLLIGTIGLTIYKRCCKSAKSLSVQLPSTQREEHEEQGKELVNDSMGNSSASNPDDPELTSKNYI